MKTLHFPVEHTLRIGSGGGVAVSYRLTDAEYADYVKDPETAIERLTGVPYAVVWQWVESEGRPQCIAVTRRRKQCKMCVPGVLLSTPQEWHRYGGGYCYAHSEAA